MKPKTHYTDERIAFICLNYHITMSASEVAAEIGTPVKNLNSFIQRLRRYGYVIASDRVRDGEIRTKSKNGVSYQEVKQGSKWVYIKGSYIGTGKKPGNPKRADSSSRRGKTIKDKGAGKIVASTPTPVRQMPVKKILQNPDKPKALCNDRNSDTVVIKKDTGGRFEYDPSRRLYAYKQNRAV